MPYTHPRPLNIHPIQLSYRPPSRQQSRGTENILSASCANQCPSCPSLRPSVCVAGEFQIQNNWIIHSGESYRCHCHTVLLLLPYQYLSPSRINWYCRMCMCLEHNTHQGQPFPKSDSVPARKLYGSSSCPGNRGHFRPAGAHPGQ